jgi:aminoglycoside 3-N-acetyltransferase
MSIIFKLRQKFKKIFGIKSITLLYKKRRRHILKLFFRKKYTAKDLVALMKTMGMKKGSVVFIHSSMTEFYNYSGTGEELITEIINIIGEEGTLLMPAYPSNRFCAIRDVNDCNGVDFDVNKTPSAAGYLTEVFRKYPGVKRSINLQHSVCAYGKDADYFVSEHHLEETPWNKKSPYYKLYLKEALVFAFGLPYFLGTTIHCTEDLLKNKYQYFSLFFTKKMEYKYRDSAGNIGYHKILLPGLHRKRSKKKMIKRYFDSSEFHLSKISNLRVEMVNAKYMLDVFLAQAEKGNVMYTKPSPKPYKQNGKFIPLQSDEK